MERQKEERVILDMHAHTVTSTAHASPYTMNRGLTAMHRRRDMRRTEVLDWLIVSSGTQETI